MTAYVLILVAGPLGAALWSGWRLLVYDGNQKAPMSGLERDMRGVLGPTDGYTIAAVFVVALLFFMLAGIALSPLYMR